jgi:dethiobiotin synthetase
VRGLFVTGTDTGVGKTVACAALMVRYRQVSPRLRYWKPIQTGIEQDDDTATVARLIMQEPAGRRPGPLDPAIRAGEPDPEGSRVLDAGVRLPRPLSPHLAARLAGRPVDPDALVALPIVAGSAPFIVEGAGGVLVPLNESTLMIDLMARLALPVLVVARSGLGTINHTLLTLEALRARSLTIAGVLMVGLPNPDNRDAIEQYGRTAVIGALPPLDPLTPETLAAAASGLDRDRRLQAWLG